MKETNPTLEELIELCGDRFKEIYTYKDRNGSSKWVAYSNNKHEFEGMGDTHREAVENLLMELNK